MKKYLLFMFILIPILSFGQKRAYIDSIYTRSTISSSTWTADRPSGQSWTQGQIGDSLEATIAGQSVNIREHLENINMTKDSNAVYFYNTDDTLLIGQRTSMGMVKGQSHTGHAHHQPSLIANRGIMVAPRSNGYGSLNLVSGAGFAGYSRGVNELVWSTIDTNGIVVPMVNMGIDAYHPLSTDSLPTIFVWLARNNMDGSVSDKCSYVLEDGLDIFGNMIVEGQMGFNTMPPIAGYAYSINIPSNMPASFTGIGLHRNATSMDSTNAWLQFSASPSKYTVFKWEDSTSTSSTMALSFRSRLGQYDYANGLGNRIEMRENNNEVVWYHGAFTHYGSGVLIDPNQTEWNDHTLSLKGNQAYTTPSGGYKSTLKMYNMYNANGTFNEIGSYSRSGVKDGSLDFVHASTTSNYGHVDIWTRQPYNGFSRVARFDSLGNVLINTTNTVEGNSINEINGKIIIGDSNTPDAYPANASGIYSKSGELYAFDSAGNETLLSPHDSTGKWIFLSKNIYTGEVIQIDMQELMLDLAKEMSAKTGKTYIHRYDKH